MGWLITGGILLLLAVLPLGVKVGYDSDGVRLQLVLGPIRLTLFPRPKKQPKEKRRIIPNRKKKNHQQRKRRFPSRPSLRRQKRRRRRNKAAA